MERFVCNPLAKSYYFGFLCSGPSQRRLNISVHFKISLALPKKLIKATF